MPTQFLGNHRWIQCSAPVLLVVLSGLFACCQAFTVLDNTVSSSSLSPTLSPIDLWRFGGTMTATRLEATTTAATASQSSATTFSSTQSKTPTLENWRVVSKAALSSSDDNEDKAELLPSAAQSILEERCEWSSQAFDNALEWYHQLHACNDTYISSHLQEALKVLNDAYRLYGPSCGVICSFNGGKDACVILELVRAAHAKYYADLQQEQGVEDAHNSRSRQRIVRPRMVYWDKKGEFREVSEFVKGMVQEYDLDMIAFEQGIHFTQGLKMLVDGGKTPLAFVLGTRSSDPNAVGQGVWEPSSASFMPPFMRVNPILDWDYGRVWQFLRSFQVPVCSLYEKGYTSLGTTADTFPNPALFVPSTGRYREAWMLTDYDQERAGRSSKPKVKQTSAPPATASTNSSLSTLYKINHQPTDASPIDQVPKEIRERPPPVPMESDISYGSDTTTQRTVGLLIIGDEILKGYTVDTNSQAAATALRQENVLLKRIVVVSDDLEDIVEEIGRMQQQVDVIVTSGGVGPTHDDVTIKSVAAALGCELELHSEMAQLLKAKMGTEPGEDLSEAQMKMATLPANSKLRYLSDDEKAWPVLQCRNVFILPGVPEFFVQKMEQVATYLSCQLERSSGYKVVLSVDETSIVPYLNQVVERHQEHVTFGSYPFVNQPDRKTVITVEGKLCGSERANSAIFDKTEIDLSKDAVDQHVQRALDDLIATLPENCVVRVDVDDMLLFQ